MSLSCLFDEQEDCLIVMLQQRRRVCLDCKASLATQRRTRETRILKPEMRSLQKVVSVGKGDVSKT